MPGTTFDAGRREYCEVLGVPIDADDDAVKRAYKRLALEYHPDRPNNKGKEDEANKKFHQVTEAYEKLQTSNTTLNTLKNCFKSTEIHSSLEHFLFTTGSSLNNFQSSLNSKSTEFSSTYGGQSFNIKTSRNNSFSSASSSSNTSSPNSTPSFRPFVPQNLGRKGQSLKTTLKITFSECINGCTKTIEFTRSSVCKCKHSQTSPFTIPFNGNPNCRDCGGRGVLKAVINGGNLGGSSITTACPTCSNFGLRNVSNIHGSSFSFVSMEVCSLCSGTGRTTTKKKCTVQIPPGVYSGMQKLYEGEGDESEDGPSGDLIVCFEVESHNFFQRKGDDAHCQVTLTFPQACLGTTLDILSMYPNRMLEIQVRPGTQYEDVIKLEQEGFFNLEKQKKGDLIVHFTIAIPKSLSPEEGNILKSLVNNEHFKSLWKETTLASTSTANAASPTATANSTSHS